MLGPSLCPQRKPRKKVLLTKIFTRDKEQILSIFEKN